MLHEFIAVKRDEIIRRCRAKVAARSVPPPTAAEIDHGVPVFLDQLRDALRFGQTTSPEIDRSAIRHGHDLLRQGFTVSQVVHDYGDVCQAITELAVELNAPISTNDFRTLNRCLDDAIAGAVTEYGRERTQSGIDGESARGSERLGFFAHELRNLMNTAILAFEVLKTGNVGVGGSTGTVLHRSLMAAAALISRSLAEVGLTQGIQSREQFRLAGFVEEVAAASALDANARGVTLIVTPVEDDIAIEADRHVLAAVVANLLQKPNGSLDELFRPFKQRSADRTGVGIGLAFSRWGAEANGGRSMRGTFPVADACSPSNCPDSRCPPSLSYAVNGDQHSSDEGYARFAASRGECRLSSHTSERRDGELHASRGAAKSEWLCSFARFLRSRRGELPTGRDYSSRSIAAWRYMQTRRSLS